MNGSFGGSLSYLLRRGSSLLQPPVVLGAWKSSLPKGAPSGANTYVRMYYAPVSCRCMIYAHVVRYSFPLYVLYAFFVFCLRCRRRHTFCIYFRRKNLSKSPQTSKRKKCICAHMRENFGLLCVGRPSFPAWLLPRNVCALSRDPTTTMF